MEVRKILGKRRTSVGALLLAAAAAAGVFATTALSSEQSTSQSALTIRCRNAAIVPKQARATAGRIVIGFRNAGTRPMRLRVAGLRTPVVRPRRSATLIVPNLDPGTFKTACTVNGRVTRARSGTLVVRQLETETTEG
jgi:hypothetical protein